MDWITWALMLCSAGLAAGTYMLKPAKSPTAARITLTVSSFVVGLAVAVLASIAAQTMQDGNVPFTLVVLGSVLLAISIGSPFTELIFHLAATHRPPREDDAAGESPLRGGLWIGLLERTAIVCTLWAGWPEGIAVVLAIKGLGRFSELKNHKAAEQFILGTFSSSLCACAAYGLGLFLTS